MAAVALLAAWLAWAPAHLLALVHGAAVTACAESGYDFADGAGVLSVVRTRATWNERGWRRYDGTLMTALWAEGQHSHNCKIPLRWEHLLLGVQFVLGDLPVPDGVRSAGWYCGKYDAPGACEARGGREIVGKILHVYWAN